LLLERSLWMPATPFLQVVESAVRSLREVYRLERIFGRDAARELVEANAVTAEVIFEIR
jgi:hypothetical protein